MAKVLHFRLVHPRPRDVFDWLEARNADGVVVRHVGYVFGSSYFLKISIVESAVSQEFENVWFRFFYSGGPPTRKLGFLQRIASKTFRKS